MVEHGRKTKTNKKAHDNTSWATWNLISLDDRLDPDLLKGRSKLIDGYLNIDEEGSE
jgi:hypothetical protein